MLHRPIYLHSLFSALERTFLGYLRTSLALSMIAVLITQLFRLQHSDVPDKTFGFFVLGIPLACIFIIAAIFVLLLGSYRVWRQQNAILRGKIHVGGWEINAVGVTISIVCPLGLRFCPCLIFRATGHNHSFCTTRGCRCEEGCEE